MRLPIQDILVELVIFICLVLNIVAAESGQCKNHEEIICVEPSGFYYMLGNGTWNLSWTESEAVTQIFLNRLQNSKCFSTSSDDNPKCGNNCCYCELGSPLPVHPITNVLIRPTDIKCGHRLERKIPYKTWNSVKTIIQLCKSDSQARFPFLCILFDNLKKIPHMYTNPKIANVNQMRGKRSKLSWRNTSSLINVDPQTPKSSVNLTKSSNYQVEDDVEIPVRELHGIRYTVTSDLENEMDNVTVEFNPVNNQSFSFTGKT